MANSKRAVADNVGSDFFVDETCINCDACRKFAPELFGDNGETSFVKKEPETSSQLLNYQQALLSCPVGSIGVLRPSPLKQAQESFPLELVPSQIYLNGFNHRSSFGADSYFIRDPKGNWLVDSPRFHKPLVKKWEEMGGVSTIFLTHRDDVADCEKIAQYFGAKLMIHEREADALSRPDLVLKGSGPFIFSEGRFVIDLAPGHTEGHCLLRYRNKYLFTGDHFAWLSSLERFGCFRRACWFSWDQQIESVKKMVDWKQVTHIFPGHGSRGVVKEGDFPCVVKDVVKWMEGLR